VSRRRAWAELLRAPLLLSPLADVLAGWAIGFRAATTEPARLDPRDAGGLWHAARESSPALAGAMAAGLCLLAAGMAQNALADREDDARRKPQRPLPRGALTPASVRAAWLALSAGGLALASAVSPAALALAAAILALTAAYHYALKPFRTAGCLTLGALRGLDLLLGCAVVEAWLRHALPGHGEGAAFALDPQGPLLVALLYALFMAGASLHASTDDEPRPRPTSLPSTLGVAQQTLALALLTVLLSLPLLRSLPRATDTFLPLAGALAIPAWALVRLLAARSRLPPGPFTGVMLSGLYLFDAAVCCAHPLVALGLGTSAIALALFGASRLMRRAFPPT